MTTKHRAKELADSFLSVPYEIDFRQWVEIQDLLRTIPSLEADIEKLKAENKVLIDVITMAEVKPDHQFTIKGG